MINFPDYHIKKFILPCFLVHQDYIKNGFTVDRLPILVKLNGILTKYDQLVCILVQSLDYFYSFSFKIYDFHMRLLKKKDNNDFYYQSHQFCEPSLIFCQTAKIFFESVCQVLSPKYDDLRSFQIFFSVRGAF